MIVIKIGGSIVDGLHASIIDDIKGIVGVGIDGRERRDKLVIVHGGGKEVTRIANMLGKEQRFIVSPEGIRSRYTDKETIEIFTMVMAGKINKEIVSFLLKNNVNAIGLSGIDASIINAERKKRLIIVDERGRRVAIDGGYTGKISKVNSRLLNLLLDADYIPVIAPIAIDSEFEMLNVDGDRAAAYIAGGLSADRVIFLTDVNGLMMDGKLVEHLTLDEAKRMLPRIGHGMEKKVLACTEALSMGVREAIIASGKVENPINKALNHTNCTVIEAVR